MKAIKLFLLMIFNWSVYSQIAYKPIVEKINLGENGENKAYYKLNSGVIKNTKNEINWHLAFQIDNDRGFGIRANTSSAICTVYKTDKTELSQVTKDNYNSLARDSDNELYNSTVDWNIGALNNDHWDDQSNPHKYYIGWGAYDIKTHKVNGNRVFIIRHSIFRNGTWQGDYYKLKINSRFRNYVFSYSKFNGSDWGPEKTQVINDLDYRYSGNKFVYYNLDTHSVVDEEPQSWDLLFTTYDQNLNKAEINPSDNMYTVTGCLHKYGLVVAEVLEEDQVINSNFENLTYKEDMNVIGYDWKEFNFQFYNPGYTMSKKKFYVKTLEGDYYRVFLKYKVVNRYEREMEIYKQKLEKQVLSTQEFRNDSFNIYPTVLTSSKVTIETSEPRVFKEIEMLNSTGQMVYHKNINSTVNQLEIDLPENINKGIYIVKINTDNKVFTTRLVK
ncbi:T9SS type A sorting domain-containing protein [Flavobacterium columnare]|uniref:T9SS type A sorting domain-containing protein n=1 Tax=Flavobacterium columnare TaxID=996 RepID=UPI001785E322|nr:T9SS type A sorting domain-containing protein [Flavobacterium columnare]QOG88706.1 T9SS type A sorting domain-containing protein [Flavobacterium columnare]QOG91365.1 T9SS type A sorting domain-containing protein [Flavobacterium columnare]QOG94028.1 T9SS type A sorting domain-containing protein [Flavobacterium columnare]QOG96687.1 T9SS type A sorting domain-containing protein [Flavobacterium columnare]QOG99345.1 T9SS type A sorting domain-containing protein [Flavobacterium columnare]